MTLQPGQTAYLVTYAQTDNNAAGVVTLDIALSGRINNQDLDSDYLTQIVKAMRPDVVILNSGTDDEIEYQFTGTVQANTLGTTSTEVTSNHRQTCPSSGATSSRSGHPSPTSDP